MKNREAQAKEKEKLFKEIRNLKEQVKKAAESQEEVEAQLAAANAKIAEVNTALEVKFSSYLDKNFIAQLNKLLGSCHKRQKPQAPKTTSANAASANP